MAGRVRKGVLALLLVAIVAAPVGWIGSNELESRNAFCVACHLDADTPLHAQKRQEFESRAPRSLAAVHWAARGEGEPGFRCIDCHGGASFPNQLRVKTVAARDALMWLAGSFDEPDHMKHPLWDEDCAQCHERYAPVRDDSFHAIADHNIEFAHACVECHLTHSTDVNPDLYYLNRETVLPVCRNCHKEF
jgi:hypothetical protein